MKAFLFLVLLTQQGLHYEKYQLKITQIVMLLMKVKLPGMTTLNLKMEMVSSGVFIFTTIDQL